MENLDEAISAYETGLAELPQKKAEGSKSKVMAVFIARDNVAHALADNKSATSDMLSRIAELDQRLRKGARRINAIVGRSTLAGWRESFHPPESAWWWSLDLHPAGEPKFFSIRALLVWFSWIVIAVSLSFILEVVRRFLSTGADIPSIVLQGLLALLVGSTIVQLVGQVAGGMPRQSGGKKVQSNQKALLILALFLLIVAVGLNRFRPALVSHYSDKGVLNKEMGQLTTAIESYQQAISLKPDDSLAHYNLASAYEETLEYDKAESEFQAALRCSDQYCLAYMRLARLHMLRRKDFVSALILLKTGLEKLDQMKVHKIINEEDHQAMQFALLRNRGWAYFGLGYFSQATNDLNLALEIRPRGAVAHCLLAQVLESETNPQRNQKKAMEEYTKCVAYSQLFNDMEENWLSLARERLEGGGLKKEKGSAK